MGRDSTSRAMRIACGRALRRRAAVAVALLLAACAHWPMSLPGVSTADAAPESSSGSTLGEGTANPAAATADHTDGLRTFGGASRVGSAFRQAAATAGIAATPLIPPSATQRPSAGPAPAPAQVSKPEASAGNGPDESGAPSSVATEVSAADVASATTEIDADSPGASGEAGFLSRYGTGPSTGESAGAVIDGVGARAANANAASAGASASAFPSASPAKGDATPHGVAVTAAAGAQRGDKVRQINERAKWWLVAIVATLLLLLIAGRRKRRPPRVMKVNMHRVEPAALGPPTPALRKPVEIPRVRMFSAYEIYSPTHHSHRAPWEAPMTTERGFAHRYEVGEEIAEGLLFVPDAALVWASLMGHAIRAASDHIEPEAASPEPRAIGPTVPAMLAVESPSQPVASPANLPVSADAPTEFSALQVGESSIITPPPRDGMRPAEEIASPVDPIAAIERDTASAFTPGIATAMQSVDDRPKQQAIAALHPARHEASRPAGATMLDPAELGLSATMTREAGAGVATASHGAVAAAEPAHRNPIAEARRLVDAGEYASALAHLDVALKSARPSVDAWLMSALCWWQIARADGGSQAYANAADAMERLLERDPAQADIWYRSGSCRLLQAAGERGAARRATLDLAVAALRRAVSESGTGDPLWTATLGDALSERALAATDETTASRAKRMAEAVRVLRDAARLARDPTSPASWKLQQALQMQASLLPGTEASKVRLEADAVLAAGAGSANEHERPSWYAAKVENELAHAELADGATRTLHLRTFRENYRDVLTGPDAAPELLLSWLELLALETRHLRGDATRSRFDEGEAILKRLDSMLPGNAHVALARARLLRRRAAQSNAVSRPAVLSGAITGLMPLVERGDAPQLQIEVAELMLERAACVPSSQANEELARAEAMASGLLEHPMYAMPAARCVLQARLGQSSGAIDPPVCRRLEALAGDDVRSRWLLARAALRNGAPREACGHCEAAAKSGARLDQALVQLWDQASRQWSATLHGQKDAAWLANKQCLRSAS